MTLIPCIKLYHFWTSQLCAPINPRLFGLNWCIHYLLLHNKLLQNLVAGKKTHLLLTVSIGQGFRSDLNGFGSGSLIGFQPRYQQGL